ncbi:protein of unknown function DUF402 [Haloterrigena turkmenica DSM 5511]|uniref:Probable ribonuclease FAU-1 n=1 Tax=Haloterrigena turkmenica (strain ATCC 51198 / DSM 5511 / JCM 9101 / NCIMB 13204 / VKM B-1734 / 4k) TaxID=543526 RepID=D2RPI4_HALTV|nr:DUF402 domain-containing protein [Haloterrigena turkmenica]ADB62136.1 protein of unknown function DUF402 [Haloterrigena turkmenica DSM 5511]
MTTGRVRGIYTTAITQLLRNRGLEVVQASDPIRERFDASFEAAPADVAIETTRDRQGVELSGDPDAVETVASELESLAIDSFRWDDDVPRGAVFDCEVVDAGGGGGATVDLGDGRRGYLHYDDVDGYVDSGNRYRVQVTEPVPPWAGDDPRVEPTLEVGDGLVALSRDRTGVSAALRGERADELVGMTDLLSVDVPDDWGVRWQGTAADADLEAMGTALERAVDRALELEDALADAPETPGEPGRLAAPRATTWAWFGRESRFALDGVRREVETTMAGHHRTKAADRAVSAAVDFAEAVCDSPGESGDDGDGFPFGAVSSQFGPTTGDRLEIGHGKPDGRLISLGRGEVTDWDADGSVTLERSMRGGGSYDALGVPKEEGDVAVTKFREGRWWYPTTYKDETGTAKGTYVNVCTPVELFPDAARYVDLYVDVIRHADGTVETVDADELEAAVDDGHVSEELAEKATNVAAAVERALSK